MRSRDDLQRQARTLSPGQRCRSRRASTKWLDGDGGEWRGCWLPKVVCDRPCADTVCLPKTLSGMTRGWAYGNEAADGRISDPAAACYLVAVHTSSAA